MRLLWAFLSDEKNQRTLAWLGGGLVVAAGGIWAVVTFVWPPHHEPGPTPAATSAQTGNCGIASVGSSSGNSINCGNAAATPAAKP